MSSLPEIQSPEIKKAGRDYYIEYLDLAEFFLNCQEDKSFKNLDEEKQKNMDGIVDYTMEGTKGRLSPSAHFSTIRDSLLRFNEEKTQFDLVKGTSGKIIPRGTSVISLLIPQVIFPEAPKTNVTPLMLRRSLGSIANHITRKDLNIDFVIGLTHPRIGNIAARRWGFTLEDHPLPTEIYKLLDKGIDSMKKYNPTAINVENLEAFRRQVLVYQTKDNFVKRATI